MILGNERGVPSRATNLLDSGAGQMQMSKSDAALKSRQHFISSAHPAGDQIGHFDVGGSLEHNQGFPTTQATIAATTYVNDSGLPNQSLTHYLQPHDVSKLSADPQYARHTAPSPLHQDHHTGSAHLNTVSHHSHKDQHSVASHLNSVGNPPSVHQFNMRPSASH